MTDPKLSQRLNEMSIEASVMNCCHVNWGHVRTTLDHEHGEERDKRIVMDDREDSRSLPFEPLKR
jgi:hypothetical protein